MLFTISSYLILIPTVVALLLGLCFGAFLVIEGVAQKDLEAVAVGAFMTPFALGAILFILKFFLTYRI